MLPLTYTRAACGRKPRAWTLSAEGHLSDAAFEQKVKPALVNWMEGAVRRLLAEGLLVEIRRGGVRHIEPATRANE